MRDAVIHLRRLADAGDELDALPSPDVPEPFRSHALADIVAMKTANPPELRQQCRELAKQMEEMLGAPVIDDLPPALEALGTFGAAFAGGLAGSLLGGRERGDELAPRSHLGRARQRKPKSKKRRH